MCLPVLAGSRDEPRIKELSENYTKNAKRHSIISMNDKVNLPGFAHDAPKPSSTPLQILNRYLPPEKIMYMYVYVYVCNVCMCSC